QALKEFGRAKEALQDGFRIDGDKTKLDNEMAQLENRQGNEYFSNGNYHEAVERYTRATELDPSDALFLANLGGAWEQSKESDAAGQRFDRAIEAYKRAHTLNPAAGYANTVERLARNKAFAARYGETALEWTHVVTPLAVEVANDLIPYVQSSIPSSLTDNLSKLISEMRARIKQRFGVSIPAVRCRGNETHSADGSYILMISEVPLVSGRIRLDRRFCPKPPEILGSIGIIGERATNPLTGGDGSWINRDDWPKAEAADAEL